MQRNSCASRLVLRLLGSLMVHAVAEAAPPEITVHPEAGIHPVGFPLRLTVAANGSTPMDIRWHFNGVALQDDDLIQGSRSPLLSLLDPRPSSSGVYEAVVTSAEGQARSRGATLRFESGLWENLNPGAGGQIQDIVLDPNTPGRAFLMSDVDGSYVTHDGGETWAWLTSDSGSTNHLTLTVEPGNPRRLYLGRINGLDVSDDAGRTWRNVPNSAVTGAPAPEGFAGEPIMQVVVDRTDARKLWAGMSSRWRWSTTTASTSGNARTGQPGIYRSEDRGLTWLFHPYGPNNTPRDTYSIVQHPKDPGTVFLGGWNGVFRSLDAGRSWTQLSPPEGVGRGWGIDLSPDGSVLYAAFAKQASSPDGDSSLWASPISPEAGDLNWVDLMAGPDSPVPGRYWLPRVDPLSSEQDHRILIASNGGSNPRAGLSLLRARWAGRNRPERTWELPLKPYLRQRDVPFDIGWEHYIPRPLAWAWTPASWHHRAVWTTGDQTLFSNPLLPDGTLRPDGWQNRYSRLVQQWPAPPEPAGAAADNNLGSPSPIRGTRTYRTLGIQTTVDFDAEADGAYVLKGNADNGTVESWDHGVSWSIDRKPGGAYNSNISRTNAVAIMRTVTPAIALAHTSSGFGANANNGTLWGKLLHTHTPSDVWIQIGGGSSAGRGLPNEIFSAIVPDPHIPGRLYVVVRNHGIFLADDVRAVIAGEGSFRAISSNGVGQPAITSDQDAGFFVDPNDSNLLFTAFGGALHRGRRGPDGSYTWQRLRTSGRLAVFKDGPRTYLAVISGATGAQEVELSDDGGGTWRSILTFATVASVRNPGNWYPAQVNASQFTISGLTGSGRTVVAAYGRNSPGQRKVYGVFAGEIQADRTVTWRDFTGNLGQPAPMKQRAVANGGQAWIYNATWGHGLWRRSLGALPRITRGPLAQPLGTSEAIELVLDVAGDALTYQWFRGGVAVPGGTGRSLILPRAELASLGEFYVEVSNAAGTLRSGSPRGEASPSPLPNLSSRGYTGPGSTVLTMGFVIAGPQRKTVGIRGVGPSLAVFGVTGAIASPYLRIVATEGRVVDETATQTAWDLNRLLGLGAFAASSGPLEPISFVDLPPGTYTAQIYSTGQPGTALGEIYDAAPRSGSSRLINLSTRGRVSPDSPLIAGLVVPAGFDRSLLLRAAGPTLGSFGVPDALTAPKLTVFSSSGVALIENSSWSELPSFLSTETAMRRSGAFPFARGSRDAALLLNLAPGAYTLHVSSLSHAGIALAEVYELP